MVVPGLLFVAAAMVVLGFADRLSLFLVAAVLYGIGFGTVQPTLQALSVVLVPPDRRGAASATFYSAFDLGITAGAVVGGLIAGAAGYGVMFLLLCVPALAALLVFWTMGVRESRRTVAA